MAKDTEALASWYENVYGFRIVYKNKKTPPTFLPLRNRIVTVDDALDVLQEETTEDFEKMAAITPTDRPYLKKSVLEIWRSRIPWLLVLMISATFTGMIINHFEDVLKTYVLLTAYIHMLMDTGGN